jgi:hypothetical protein
MTGERTRVVREAGTFGLLSLLTFVGALLYFLQHADGFWGIVLAVLEAMVWPAIVIFHVLGVLGA